MIPPTKASMEKFLFAKDISFKIGCCFDPCIGFATVQIFEKKLITVISLDIEKFKLLPLPFLFLRQNFKWNYNTSFEEYSTENILVVQAFIFVPMCRKIQREQLQIFRYSNSCFTITTRFVSTFRIGIEISRLEVFSMRKLLISVLCISV